MKLMKTALMLVCATVWIVSTAHAQAPAVNPLAARQAVPDADEVRQFFPELAAMPVPEWIKVGTRLTYLTSGGHDEGDGQLIPTPDGKVIEKGTGRRFFHWPRDDNYLPGGGSAFTQVDVAAIAGPIVVLDQGGYGFEPMSGTLSLDNPTGLATHSGFNTWWVNPAGLRKLADSGGGERFVVLEMPYAMDGQQYRALRIQSMGTGGSYTAYTYDLVSGILLRRVIVGDPSGVMTETGQFRGRRSITVSTLKNSRQLKLPWLDGAQPATVPDWVARINGLTLKGSALFITPGQGQMPATPIDARYTVRARGTNWLRYSLAMHEIGAAGIAMDATGERACGPGSLQGLWIDPQVLQRLAMRQVIDEDPVTRVSTVVTFTGPAPDGRQAVGISQISPKTRIDVYYDAQSGMLKRHVLIWDTPTAQNVRTVDVVGTW
jgi:hypothetical protein